MRDRAFLALVVLVISLFWGWLWWIATPAWGYRWLESVWVGLSIVGLTYIEILGVAYFSRKRGWRVSLRLAERVGCYAAVGWLPAVVLFAGVWLLNEYGFLARWWPSNLGNWNTPVQSAALLLLAGVSMMGFELLVWLGIRRVKYANGLRAQDDA